MTAKKGHCYSTDLCWYSNPCSCSCVNCKAQPMTRSLQEQQEGLDKMDATLTNAMCKALRGLVESRNAFKYCRGQSEHGGMNSTLNAMKRRGLVTGEGALTGRGREAYESAAVRKWRKANGC